MALHRPRADVVIPVYADVELTRTCVESVLEHSGGALGRLLLVDDCGPDAQMRPMLRAFRERDPRVRVLENPQNLGFVGTANRGLSLCDGHAVILNSDTRVTPGWLEAMLEVLSSSERIAAVCPLSNNGTLNSVPSFGRSVPEASVAKLPGSLGSLPLWTELPTGNGFCMLMRDTARAALGLFDPAYGRGYNEENDWCQRARAQGMRIARANRAFVFHRGEVSFGAARPLLDLVNATRLVARYPRYLDENRSFDGSPAAHLAAAAARTRLRRERWSLHPDLEAMPGVGRLLHSLREARGAEALTWSVPPPPGSEEIRLAPLDHESPDAARAALQGTGRLVTLMDALRPVPMGPLRALRWAQLQASDAVWVPSAKAASMLAEEGITENVRVVPWPSAVAPSPSKSPPAEESLKRSVLLVSPTPAIRVLVEFAITALEAPLELHVVTAGVSPGDFSEALQGALALLDFGGTSAAHLKAAVGHAVPVLSALTSIAQPPQLPSLTMVPSVEGVATALNSLRETRLELPASEDPTREWERALEEVLLQPASGRAEVRASLQTLIAL